MSDFETEKEEASMEDIAEERARFVAAIERGLAEIAAGLGISDEELGRELDEEFGKLEEE